jgi:hypothetical protein
MTIGTLVTLTALQGVIVAFNQPAPLALVPSLVPPADESHRARSRRSNTAA